MSLDYIENKTVHAIYIIPSNRIFNQDFKKAKEYTMKEVQGWYSSQLNGLTFKLSDPIVKVLHSKKNENWFIESTHHDERNAGYYNTLEECDLHFPKIRDINNKFAMYLDGGKDGAGLYHACILVKKDLDGIVLEMSLQAPGQWIGGSAHELGHPLNLKDHENGGLMHNGQYLFPNTWLTADEKLKLSK